MQTPQEMIDEMVRDFTQVTPRSKSEVRERITSLHRKLLEEEMASFLTTIKNQMLGEVEKMKFPSKDGDSKELPYTEYPTAKPAHESNAVFMQHAYNQALKDVEQAIINKFGE